LGEVETIPEKKRIVAFPKRELEEKEDILVDNYGKMIIEARKKRNLTREEFAKKINEKESVIRRVEAEEMEPDDTLIEKIERFLEIKLKKPYEKTIIGKKEIKGSLTLGDVVELKE
jgi:putative transcription factor